MKKTKGGTLNSPEIREVGGGQATEDTAGAISPIPPITPDAPQEPDAPIEAEAQREEVARGDLSSGLQAARQEIEQIERSIGGGRRLTEDEKQIIYAKHLGEAANVIDQRTAEIYQQFEQSTRLTRSTKWTRFLGAAGRVMGTAAAGIGLRTLIGMVPWGAVGAVAGTITGALIGGVIGGVRAKSAAEKAHRGASAWVEEYRRIKEEERDPYARENALAFLESALANPERFRGNHSELLQLLSFYRREATQAMIDKFAQEDGAIEATQETIGAQILAIGGQRLKIDEQTVASISQALEAIKSRSSGDELFQKRLDDPNVRAKTNKAIWMGVLKGAAIGAGVGAVSDLIGWWMSGARSEAAYEQYLHDYDSGEHFSYVNREYAPTPTEAIPPFGLPEETLVQYDLSPIPTDYGNALKHAIYSNHIQPPSGVSETDFREFLRSLNYVNPTTPSNIAVPVEAPGIAGGDYHFDQDSLQQFVNTVFTGERPDLGIVSKADEIISSYHEAIEGAAQITAQEAAQQGVAETVAHGATIGAAAGIAGEKIGKHKPKDLATPAVALPEAQAQQMGGESDAQEGAQTTNRDDVAEHRGEGGTEEASREEGEQTDGKLESEQVAGRESTESAQEARRELGGLEFWMGAYGEGQSSFAEAVRATIDQLKDKGWGGLSEAEKQKTMGLFQFIHHAQGNEDCEIIPCLYKDDRRHNIARFSFSRSMVTLSPVSGSSRQMVTLDLANSDLASLEVRVEDRQRRQTTA